jgi:hypothetical protein
MCNADRDPTLGEVYRDRTSLSSWWRLLLSITLITLSATNELLRRSTALRTWLLAPAPITCGIRRQRNRAQLSISGACRVCPILVGLPWAQRVAH